MSDSLLLVRNRLDAVLFDALRLAISLGQNLFGCGGTYGIGSFPFR